MEWLDFGARLFIRSIRVRTIGFKGYEGKGVQIVRKIISDCWLSGNKRFFAASAGHFRQFWTRDFGISCESLIKLGYREQVIKTLTFALEKFSKSGVATTIFPNGKPRDFPTYAIDSLAFLLRSLRIAKAKGLVERYKSFLEREARKVAGFVSESGILKPFHFSSLKDHSIRKSSCYDNTMLALINEELKNLKLQNPLPKENYPKLLIENFWNGEYFYDDLQKSNYVPGDANTIPFWLGIVRKKRMLSSSLRAVQKHGLDKPLPLRYTSRKPSHRWIWHRYLAPGYETKCSWSHLGLIYLQLLKKAMEEEYEKVRETFFSILERDKNLFEFFLGTRPYKSLLYVSDEAMLWSSLLCE